MGATDEILKILKNSHCRIADDRCPFCLSSALKMSGPVEPVSFPKEILGLMPESFRCLSLSYKIAGEEYISCFALHHGRNITRVSRSSSKGGNMPDGGEDTLTCGACREEFRTHMPTVEKPISCPINFSAANYLSGCLARYKDKVGS